MNCNTLAQAQLFTLHSNLNTIDRYEGSATCYVLKDMTLDNISLLALPEHRVRIPWEAS
jgi:hypothetical protein